MTAFGDGKGTGAMTHVEVAQRQGGMSPITGPSHREVEIVCLHIVGDVDYAQVALLVPVLICLCMCWPACVVCAALMCIGIGEFVSALNGFCRFWPALNGCVHRHM